MKIAITSTGDSLDSPVDRAFGRCQQFLIVDESTSQVAVIDNAQNLDLPQGAGIQAARTVVDQGVDYVLTGHCGPKAFKALQAAGVGVVLNAEGTVSEAIDAFRSGRLLPAERPDVEGHWA